MNLFERNINQNAGNELTKQQKQAYEISKVMLGICEEATSNGKRLLQILKSQGKRLITVEETLFEVEIELDFTENDMNDLERSCMLSCLPRLAQQQKAERQKETERRAHEAHEARARIAEFERVDPDRPDEPPKKTPLTNTFSNMPTELEQNLELNLQEVRYRVQQLKYIADVILKELNLEMDDIARIKNMMREFQDRIIEISKQADNILREES